MSDTTDTNLGDEVFDWPIERLDFSTRVENCVCYYAKVKTVGDLVAMTRRDLMDLRGFGERSMMEVEHKIGRLGLSLGMQLKADACFSCKQIIFSLTVERDQARRDACHALHPSAPEELAKHFGWDCFKGYGK